MSSASNGGTEFVTVEPHDYVPLRWWDRLVFRLSGHPPVLGRCRHCYYPGDAHPISKWVQARPLGDKRMLPDA